MTGPRATPPTGRARLGRTGGGLAYLDLLAAIFAGKAVLSDPVDFDATVRQLAGPQINQ